MEWDRGHLAERSRKPRCKGASTLILKVAFDNITTSPQ